MRLLLRRRKEWIRVLMIERRSAHWMDMIRLLLSGWVDRKTWFHRMLKCHHCPIFDRDLKRCGPIGFPNLGCRCFCPIKALTKKATCYGNDHVPDFPYGWRR